MIPFQKKPATFPDSWHWDREQIIDWQLSAFNRQLDVILTGNRFYQKKMAEAGLTMTDRLNRLEDLHAWPLTTKQELIQAARDTDSKISPHHTFPEARYSRLHRTSGTSGEPMMILDSCSDWQWWSDTWQHVLSAAEVTPDDRVFLAFSFGPFIGFWSAHQACVDLGAMVIPAGGLSTLARLDFLRQSQATVVCCTPTYALHMAEVAQAEGFPLAELPVRRLIVAGEPGGSLPNVRGQIESRWSCQLVDHAGATEIGPWGFGWPDRCGLHVVETSFIAELLPVDTGPDSVPHMEHGDWRELVLTSLGRHGCPVIRYRTGDVVPPASSQQEQTDRCPFIWFDQGIAGRVDQMITVRGVNVFPSSIDSLVRSLSSIGEYQVTISRAGQLDQLSIAIEAPEGVDQSLEKLLSLKLGLRIPVVLAATGSLPRSEGKARRWIDRRVAND